MDGKQFTRRSARRARVAASIVAAISSLAVASCGVEFNGLFTGDGGAEDAPSADARISDVASDARSDASMDVAVDDTSSDDVGRADATTDPGTAVDTRADASSDVTKDVASDGGGGLDAPVGDVGHADAMRDGGDGVRDADAAEPPIDVVVQDTPAEPPIDVTSEPPIDVTPDVFADGAGDAPPPGTCGGACNTFANVSPVVTRTVEQGDAPTMTGGPIVDGTYIVTSIVQYNGDMTPYSLAETSVIAGNVDAWVASTNGGPAMRYTTTFTTTNNQMAFEFCCPTVGALTILYTTTATTLSHIDPANPNRVITYTRQ
jgi:hypothetical protein